MSLEKGMVKNNSKAVLCIKEVCSPPCWFCSPSVSPSPHFDFFRPVEVSIGFWRCRFALLEEQTWAVWFRVTHQLDLCLGLIRDVQFSWGSVTPYCAGAVPGRETHELTCWSLRNLGMLGLILSTCVSKKSLTSSVAQKQFVDKSAAKKLCKLSTLLHAPELRMCVRAPRRCRAACAAQPESGRIFKVLSLLNYSFHCSA